MVIVSKPNNDRHFLSFSRKLFLSVISLFLVFAACFIAYQYQREREYKVELLDMQLQDYKRQTAPGASLPPRQPMDFHAGQLHLQACEQGIARHCGRPSWQRIVRQLPERQHELDNHIKRPEVQKALKDGKGYDLRRHLRNHRQNLFLFCHRLQRCIIRSALPYNVNLMNNLAADPHYIWFTVIVSLLLIFIFYKFTSKLGSAINTCVSLPKSRQERTHRHGHTSRLPAQ